MRVPEVFVDNCLSLGETSQALFEWIESKLRSREGGLVPRAKPLSSRAFLPMFMFSIVRGEWQSFLATVARVDAASAGSERVIFFFDEPGSMHPVRTLTRQSGCVVLLCW